MERLQCEQALAQQRLELECHRQQASSGQNLLHLQELLKLSAEETERLRNEAELLQQTLREQEAAARAEVEEVQRFAKQAQANSEKQMREFKAQLQSRSKEMITLRQEVNDA